MKIQLSRRTASMVAACALAVTPVAMTGLLPAHAADGAFSPVASLPAGTYGDLVSPADGQAYIAGRQTSGASYVKLWADGRLQDVAVPSITGASTVLDLATGGGKTFLLQQDGSVKGDVYQLSGTTATKVSLPATVPGTTSPYVTDVISADRTGLWLVIRVPDGAGDQIALHWDGTTWTRSRAPEARVLPKPKFPHASSAESLDGVLYRFLNVDQTYGRSEEGTRFDGTTETWSQRRGWSEMDTDEELPGWTFTTPDNYTMWGYRNTLPGQNLPEHVASCKHVVNNSVLQDCLVPKWAISSAARLADGRVLLGRTDGPGDLQGQADFALVDHDGAQPVDFGGDNGDSVPGLAAAPTGLTVLAVTRAGTALTLQSAVLPPKGSPSDPSSPVTTTPTGPSTSVTPTPPTPTDPSTSVTPTSPTPTSPSTTATPVPLPTELMLNGSFEAGRAHWVGSDGPITTSPARPAHSGTWKLWLGGNGTTASEYEQQAVQVPPHGKLTFWLAIDTDERTAYTKYDTAQVTVDGTVVASYSNLDATRGYVQRTIDLSRWGGKYGVTLRFSAKEDMGAQTSFVVDDVAILR